MQATTVRIPTPPPQRLAATLCTVIVFIIHSYVWAQLIKLAGAEPGDATLCGHSALLPGAHRVQLTAMSGEGWVEAMLHNVGTQTVDVGEGRLRVVVVKVL
jgi:hypothetical protein